jgi:hypothetical protein
MLLGLLLGACGGILEQFSLVPPFIYTNLSEIGTWTIRGSASNMKRYLRLTDAVAFDFGGVCHRIPVTFHDWIVELELAVHGGTGGEALIFTFTTDCCPNISEAINGFAVIFSGKRKTDESKVYIVQGRNETFLTTVLLRNQKSLVRLRVTRRGETVFLERGHEILASHVIEDTPAFGYISVFGVTSERTDVHDLHSLRTISLAKYWRETNQEDIDQWNRRLMEKAPGRKVMKQRRRAKMVVTEKYIAQRQKHNGTLDEAEDRDLSEALAIIKESQVRSAETVTIGDLMKFIDRRIALTIDKAYEKVNLAAERFEDTKIDLNDVWTNLKAQLAALAVDARSTLATMGAAVIRAAKELKLSEPDPKQVDQINETAGTVPETGDGLIAVLFWISAVEVVVYVIFFFWRRKKTHGFKKIE